MYQRFYNYWAKAKDSHSYHLLIYHCLDVSAVGNVYLEKHPALLQRICSNIDCTKQQFIAWYCYALAIHDIGKYAASFQNIIPDLRTSLIGESRKTYNIRHDVLGWWLWNTKFKPILMDTIGDKTTNHRNLLVFIKPFMQIAMGHHGRPVDKKEKCDYEFLPVDIDAALTWNNECQKFFSIYDYIPISLYNMEKSERKAFEKVFNDTIWALAGLTTLCDWIGSQEQFFPYISENITIKQYWEESIEKAKKAIESTGLSSTTPKNSFSVQSLFPGFLNYTPLQQECISLDLPHSPQCWILEDIPGSGKTEAALMLAGRIMSLGLADGLYIGLPTMATSNAMYYRMKTIYRKFFTSDSKPSLILAHSKRFQIEEFSQTVLSFDDFNLDDQIGSEQSLCTQWLADSSKKALLADIGIGTVDQVLMSILPIRHQSLRVIGLQRKVLIVDEVHAYDEYMLTLLKQLILLHGLSGGSVILLSATLSQKIKADLLSVYYESRMREYQEIEIEDSSYPLISGFSIDSDSTYCLEKPVAPIKSLCRTIPIRFHEEIETVYATIQRRQKEGSCICWIRNTVEDVIDAYKNLICLNIIPEEKIFVFHSRFIMFDRQLIEDKVLSVFGKSSTSEHRQGMILIATQVVEQSLDLDFDVLITDLAPVDLIIQRLGRLHRHIRDPFGNRGRGLLIDERHPPLLHIHSPELDNKPKKDWFSKKFPKASYVYQDTVNLWRTHQLLYHFGEIKIPEMYRVLIEGVYGKDRVPTPVGLENIEIKTSGTNAMQRSIGDFNMLNIHEGFSCASSPNWAEEEQIPSRLGLNQQRLFFGKISNDKIIPLYGDEYEWSLFNVQVRQGLFTEPILDSCQKLMIDEVTRMNKYMKENDKFILFSKERDGWLSTYENTEGGKINIYYDQELGFIIQK